MEPELKNLAKWSGEKCHSITKTQPTNQPQNFGHHTIPAEFYFYHYS